MQATDQKTGRWQFSLKLGEEKMSHLSSSYINWQRHLHRKQIDLIKFEDSYNFLKEHGVENDDKCTLKELKKLLIQKILVENGKKMVMVKINF